MKPIIVYPGSKFDFYTEIRERIPRDTRVYCEPFIGGGSTLLNLLGDMEFNIERVVVGDLSSRVAAFWRSLVSDAIGLSKRFDELFKPFDDVVSRLGTRRFAFLDFEWFGKLPKDAVISDIERYERVAAVRRDLYNLHAELVAMEPSDDLTMAAQMALLHNISYSGVAFLGGVSYQRIAKTKIAGKREMYKRAAHLLRTVAIDVVCGDYTETCSHVLDEADALIYLDPPYVLQADKLYEKGVFDHAQLAEYLSKLPESVRFLLSYDDSAYTRNLYRDKKGIKIDTYKLPRGYCAGSAGKATALNGEELFISNYII